MQFLFVNKDARSSALSRSDRGEQLEINRHAQRVQYAKRKGEKSEDQPEEPSPASPSTNPSQDVTSPEPQDPSRKTSSRQRPRKRRTQQTTPKTNEVATWHVQPAPAPPIGDAWDSFSITNIPRDPWALSILDYYFRTAALKPFKLEVELQPGKHPYERPLKELVNGCLYDPAHFFVTAALTTARIRTYDYGAVQNLIQSAPKVEWLLYQATHRLRSSINAAVTTGQVNARLLLNIHQLYYTACALEDYTAARIHINTFAHLIGRLEGDSDLDQYCRDFWHFGKDLQIAGETYTPPEYPFINDPLPDDVYHRIFRDLPPSLKRLGTRFHNAIHPGDQQGLGIMCDIVKWTHVHYHATSVTQPDHSLIIWLRDEASALISRVLLWQPMDDLEIPTILERARSDAIRGLGLFWVAVTVTYIAKLRSIRLLLPKVKPAFRAAIPGLHHKVEEEAEQSTESGSSSTGENLFHPPMNTKMTTTTTTAPIATDSDINIWLLFTGFSFAVEGNDDNPEWFRVPLLRFMKSRGITSRKVMEDLLSRYLFVGRGEEKAALDMIFSEIRQQGHETTTEKELWQQQEPHVYADDQGETSQDERISGDGEEATHEYVYQSPIPIRTNSRYCSVD